MTLQEKLLANSVDGSTTGCRLWTGARIHKRMGYGVLRWQGKVHYAHRLAYLAEYGALPPSMFICHKCDTPACIRPSHLFAGTAADNNKDARAKGRASWHNVPFGNRHGMAKLDEAAVRKVRADSRSCATIAREMGVSKSLIIQVKARTIWRHVVN